jgi:hypothetical protein
MNDIWWYWSETMLTGEFRFHISTPLGIEPRSLMMGRKRVVHWTSETWCECSEIAGSLQPHTSVADYVGCEAWWRTCICVRSSGIITLSGWLPRDGTGRSPPQTRPQWSMTLGYQCSEAILTGESRFHISTPLEIELGSLMTGSKRVVHWTSGTWCEYSEIASSP